MALGLFAAAPSVASAALFSYASPPASNVDNSTPTNIDLVVLDSSIIQDLNVGFGLDADFAGSDNTVTLTHVDTGTSATLFPSDGGNISFGDLFVTFDDEGGTLPFSPLSVFDGETVGGTWRLSIVDPTGFPGEGDDLVSWSISGTSAIIVPEPATAALGMLGLAGMSLMRRRHA